MLLFEAGKFNDPEVFAVQQHAHNGNPIAKKGILNKLIAKVYIRSTYSEG